MKKTATLLNFFLFCFVTIGQNSINEELLFERENQSQHLKTTKNYTSSTTSKGTATDNAESSILWTEDFSNGIPSTWENKGYRTIGALDSFQLWEFRGPNTQPTNLVGTRGVFASNLLPLNSPTASNGFVIFDSDYLDTDGLPNNSRKGAAPAPHRAYLTTDSIDLSGENNVSLEFYQYYRRYSGPNSSFSSPATAIEFSTDGGLNFSNRITINKDVPVNSSTQNGELLKINVSPIIGGQSDVRIRFIFEGEYYFWMLDDIALTTLPPNELQFITFGVEPSQSIHFGDTAGLDPNYGHLNINQCRDIYFSANAYNFGSQLQTGVHLQVEILDSTNAVVFTTLSNLTPVLFSRDTIVGWQLKTTIPWSTCNFPKDTYKIIYSLVSDSIPIRPGSIQPLDTFEFNLNADKLALNFGDSVTNIIGTNANFGMDNIAFGIKLEILGDEIITGSKAYISEASTPGGELTASIYDGTWFSYANGFLSQPIFTASKTLTQADIDANEITISFLGASGSNPVLTGGTYYLIWHLNSNNGSNPIFMGNDATFAQPGNNSIAYITRHSINPQWISSFTNSNIFVAPKIELLTCPDSPMNCWMSVHNFDNNKKPEIYPNPTNGVLNISFSRGLGAYEVNLVNALGQNIKNQHFQAKGPHIEYMDLSSYTPGLYQLQIIAERKQVDVFKINIQ